jgi:hypothetical protein
MAVSGYYKGGLTHGRRLLMTAKMIQPPSVKISMTNCTIGLKHMTFYRAIIT